MSVPGPTLFASRSTRTTWLAAPVLGGPVLSVGDPGSTRIVYAMVVGLAVIGVLFIFLGIWVVRQTRVDPEVLAPLERMGDREWRRNDPASQRRSLDETRPEGARPLHLEQNRPSVDAEFEKPDRPVQSFDDLRPLDPEGGDPTPSSATSLAIVADEAYESESESDADVGVEPDVDAVPDAKVTSDLGAEPDSGGESNVDVEREAATGATAEPEAEAASDSVPDEESTEESTGEATQPVEQ